MVEWCGERGGVYDHWKAKTVEKQPDGGEHVVYTNEIGQIIRLLRER